ncbi:MAG: hypothetical protein ACR2IH_10980 [Pyrinomonadaceae bacterium]
MIKRLAECELMTKYGTFTEFLYYDGQKSRSPLVMVNVLGGKDILCRTFIRALYRLTFQQR